MGNLYLRAEGIAWTACAFLAAAACSMAPEVPPDRTGTARLALAGAWSATAPLPVSRAAYTATLLPTGRVLVAGGWGDYYSTETAVLFDPSAGTWSPAASMTAPRSNHTATAISSNRVLVAGGWGDYDATSSAELYDVASDRWSTTGLMRASRANHTATPLATGDVLVAGGNQDYLTLASAEVYSVSGGTWTATGSMAQGRSTHSATLLSSGRVLVAGGYAESTSGTYSLVGTAESYDPATGTWSPAGTMIVPRYSHGAVLLPSGRVLVVGGCTRLSTTGYCQLATAEAELYDPATGLWTRATAMGTARLWPAVALLPTGLVLVAGGCTRTDSYGYCLDGTTTAELYDPAAGTWTATGPMLDERMYFPAVLLPSGGVLAAGGYDGYYSLAVSEIYDSGTGAGCRVCQADGSCTSLPAGGLCGPCRTCDATGTCGPATEGTRCGLCGGCDSAGGCTVVLDDDPDCGTLDCDGLDSSCRDYQDIEADRCGGIGTCKDPNTTGTCIAYEDATAGTACGLGFADDFESGTWSWTLDPPWARTRTDAHGGVWSLTDSPTGSYASSLDISATLAEPLSFAGAGTPVLSFWHYYDIDWDYDYGFVEVDSGDGVWVPVASYTGLEPDWTLEEIPLDGVAGLPAVRLRFRLETDYYYSADGWYVDDVVIHGLIDPCHACDGAGACAPQPDGVACPDGDSCNGDETCVGGACTAGPPPLCDDANRCTRDRCDLARGCVFEPGPDDVPCSSPFVCGGSCRAGTCIGDHPADCDDGNSCTTDTCDVAGNACRNEVRVDGAPCDDPDPCIVGGICAAGTCAGGTLVTCDDGEPCTADWCDPSVGCTSRNVADGTACDDDSICTTVDACAGGVCTGPALDCDDGDPCTVDTCASARGCEHAPAPGEPCDDGDESTSDDVCDERGLCAGSLPTGGSGCSCRTASGPAGAVPGLVVLALLLLVPFVRRRRP